MKSRWQVTGHFVGPAVETAARVNDAKLAPTETDSSVIFIWTLRACGATLTRMLGPRIAGLIPN